MPVNSVMCGRIPQHRSVDSDVLGPGKRGRELNPEQRHAPPGKHQPRDSAGDRYEETLGEHVPHEAEAAGFERKADGELAPAKRGARQHQVGDIRARDQEHDDDRSQQSVETGADPAWHRSGRKTSTS